MNSEAQAPKGRGVIWMRRVANFGFAVSAVYFVYLVAILVISSGVNSEFEGQVIGDVAVEFITDGTSSKVFDEASLPMTSLIGNGAGRKLAVVLWATWCGPCHSLLMNLNEEIAEGRLAKESVLAVSVGEPLRDVAAYLERTPLTFQVALDRQGNLAKRVKLQGTPTVMFLNANGTVEKITTGGFGLAGKISDFAK